MVNGSCQIFSTPLFVSVRHYQEMALSTLVPRCSTFIISTPNDIRWAQASTHAIGHFWHFFAINHTVELSERTEAPTPGEHRDPRLEAHEGSHPYRRFVEFMTGCDCQKKGG